MVSSFGLSCPTGGKFYTCVNNATEFIGCCTSNPCADGSGNCPKSNLRAASFSGDSYSEIPAQSCAGSGSSLWYTCQKNLPPFLGCCSTNPCSHGSCPSSDLASATLSSNATSRATFLAMGADPITSTPTPTPSNTPAATTGAGLAMGAIVGIAVGGALLLIVIAGFIIYKCGWFPRRQKKRESDDSPFVPAGLVSYPGGIQPAGSPGLPPAFPSPQTPTYPYTATSPGSPPPDQQRFHSYKPHDSVISSMHSSAGSPPPRASHFSGYAGSEATHQPMSELDATSIAAVTPELPGSEAGWSSPVTATGRNHERNPTTPQQGGMGGGIWDGSSPKREK